LNLEKRLEEYCLTPALAGFEEQMIKKLSADLKPFVDELKVDVLGNVIAKINGTGNSDNSLMVFAHTDSIGMIVKSISENGFIRMERVGGVPERILAGSKVQLLVGDRVINGLVGLVSHHLTPQDEKYKVKAIENCYIDIGATSRSEVEANGVKVGTPIVYEPSYIKLVNDRVAATSLDDRGGCALLIELASYLSKNRAKVDVYIVGTVQEEFNLRGAMVAAQQIQPTAAICIDLVAASDTPEFANPAVRVGAGPVLGTYTFHGRGTLNGLIPHPKMVALIENAAKSKNLNLQRHATVGLLTDNSYVQLVGKGIASVDICWPTRYTHSGVEMSSLKDLADLGDLLIEAVMNFPDKENFSRV
jgi:putative aminopeptidase FrvX